MSAPDQPDRARWARAADLFHRAADLPAADRTAWLLAACRDDQDLYREVSTLLEAHDRAGTFIEQPAAARTDAPSDARVPPGGMIGHYRVAGMLGEGGMGVVYLAEDSRLGRHVALKAVSPAFAGDATRTERLRREARAAAVLTHQGIATVYALEEIDGQWYIASEYVPGETLRDELARGALGPDRAIDTAAAIARALAAAHDRGIVHRDLKPANVVRAPDGSIKILDFGLARFEEGPLAAAGLTADGAVVGTPAYMSPEQIRGDTLDGRSDLFALGVVLYEMLTDVHPFAGATLTATLARILEDEPAPLVSVAPAGADRAALDRFWPLVSRALRKSPDARFQSATEMAEALETARTAAGSPAVATPAGGPIVQVPVGPSPTAIWWWQFHQAAAVASYALLLIPLWRVRDMASGDIGTGLFLLGLVGAVVACALRLHLWFALRQYPDQWPHQHAQARRWARAADVLFTIVLVAGGLVAIRVDGPSSVLLVAAAAAVAVSFLIIEPATTRAAVGGTTS